MSLYCVISRIKLCIQDIQINEIGKYNKVKSENKTFYQNYFTIYNWTNNIIS